MVEHLEQCMLQLAIVGPCHLTHSIVLSGESYELAIWPGDCARAHGMAQLQFETAVG